MWVRFLFIILVGGAFGLAAGCNQPHANWGGKKQAQSDPLAARCPVKAVVCRYKLRPQEFKSLDPEGDPNPEGFSCEVLLMSRETGRGMLADGTLQARMYRVDIMPDGTVQRPLVFESWAVDTKSIPHSLQETAFGYVYVPTFLWGDADVLGRDVEIVIEYQSLDDVKIRSKPHSSRVPGRKM
jgi:hypothetical protein